MKNKAGFLAQRHSIAVVLSAVLLSACGGDSGSSGSSSLFGGSTASNLSAVQQSYESVALVANGGFHALSGYLSMSTSSTGALSVNPSSYFYSTNSSIPQSAANGPQPLTIDYTSVASTLAVPATGIPPRYLINGTVYVESIPAKGQVSYSGANVLETYYAVDGQTVVDSVLNTGYTVVPLSGLLSTAPSELVANSAFGLLTNTINGQSLYNQQASWQPGSAYVKVVRQMAGNMVGVGDCVAPETTGTNITPCSTTISTLEAFFPYASAADGTTYQIADGQIITLAGVRAWVSNTALSSATQAYRVFYQSNGAIYVGTLIKDGTPLQNTPLAGGTPPAFVVFLNNAALQSVKSAINF
jgi:hypothetical protein